MESRHAKNAGAVFSLKYHVVWCPKYRRPVLVDGVADRLRDLLAERAAEMGMTIHAMEIMPDHVHLFVESDSKTRNSFSSSPSSRPVSPPPSVSRPPIFATPCLTVDQ